MISRRAFLMGSAAVVVGAALPVIPESERSNYVLSYYIKDGDTGWRRVVRYLDKTEAQAFIKSDPLDSARGLVWRAQLEEHHPHPSQYIETARTNYLT